LGSGTTPIRICWSDDNKLMQCVSNAEDSGNVHRRFHS
jgi:hypothetical protein